MIPSDRAYRNTIRTELLYCEYSNPGGALFCRLFVHVFVMFKKYFLNQRGSDTFSHVWKRPQKHYEIDFLKSF